MPGCFLAGVGVGQCWVAGRDGVLQRLIADGFNSISALDIICKYLNLDVCMYSPYSPK